MVERVLVIGAGMAGLWCALALALTGREVTLLERDPPPPPGGPDVAFDDWQRRGVGHLRHSHAFLARLHSLLRDEHPALLAEVKGLSAVLVLVAAGRTSGSSEQLAAAGVAVPEEFEPTGVLYFSRHY